jgi:hypothetical protein
LGCCGRAGGAGFGLALGWRIWLEWARGALSNGGVFKRIGAVLSFRFGAMVRCFSAIVLNVDCCVLKAIVLLVAFVARKQDVENSLEDIGGIGTYS